jgi:uncharacterized protein
MKRLSVSNRTRSCSLGSRVWLADGYWTRLRGLLGRPPLGEGEGLLISPSRGVHMYGMKYPLDVVLLDRGGKVVALYRELAPGRRTKVHRDARFALELPVGAIDGTDTEEGDVLEWGPKAKGGESASTPRTA